MSNITNEEGFIDFSIAEPKAPKYARVYFDTTDMKYYMKYPDGRIVDVTWAYECQKEDNKDE